jgi:type I restriction enzyme S subunit
MAVKHVHVEEVLKLQRRPVTVEPDHEYVEIGVRSFGRGIFHKEPVDGASLGGKRVYAIEPGDLVISNVFAWEGAIAVASDAESGRIGSHRFMTFVPASDCIDVRWAAWFFQSEPGLKLLQRASPGSAGRNRTLAIARFREIKIPLPPIAEQRATAIALDNIRMRLRLAADVLRRAEQLETAALEASVWEVFEQGLASGWPGRPMGEVAEINPSRDHLEDDAIIRFVPMAAVDASTGTIKSKEETRAGSIQSSYKQFRHEDVIFARITPCMQNGKIAVFDAGGHAYGSTEFHVLRPGPDAHARWIHRFLRTHRFRSYAKGRMTGTAGQQRVPAQVLREAHIPVPPLSVQLDALRQIDRLSRIGEQLHERHTRSRTLVAALLPSAVNEAFGQFR